MRDLREKNVGGSELEQSLNSLMQDHLKQFPVDWLLWLEAYELAISRLPQTSFVKVFINQKLNELKSQEKNSANLIDEGIALAGLNL